MVGRKSQHRKRVGKAPRECVEALASNMKRNCWRHSPDDCPSRLKISYSLPSVLSDLPVDPSSSEILRERRERHGKRTEEKEISWGKEPPESHRVFSFSSHSSRAHDKQYIPLTLMPEARFGRLGFLKRERHAPGNKKKDAAVLHVIRAPYIATTSLKG